MTDQELTNDQVLSILEKMKRENQSFRNLWDQLLPAFSHAEAVVAHYGKVVEALPGLQERHDKLEVDIDRLETVWREGEADVRREMETLRSSLDAELQGTREELSSLREQIVAAQGVLRDDERRHTDRRRAMDEEIRKKQEALADIEGSIEVLRAKFDRAGVQA